MNLNPGTGLDLARVRAVRVNQPAVVRRTTSLAARRSVKKDFQAAWLVKAVQCMDLTTLAGDDTPGRVRRLCAKARRPVRQDLLDAMGVGDLGLKVAAVCVYHEMVPTALEALEGSGIPVAAVAAGFPAGLSPLAERGIRALARVPGLQRLFVPKLSGADVRARDLPPHRLRPLGMPLLALRSMLDLMAQARRHLPEVRQPALLAHGEHDHTVPYACLAAFAQEIGTASEQLTCLSLPRSYHQLLLDVEREVVFEAVSSHLVRYLGAPAQD